MTKTSHDGEVTAQNQQLITAVAFIHQQFNGIEKLFWPMRAATKKFLPSVYELPGGHIDFGEDLVEGLIREIKEEFDMAISVGDAFAAFTYANDIKRSHSIEVVYFAKFTDPIENITLNPEDHSSYGWFTETEVKELFVISRPSIDDPDNANVRKGFALLRGENINFG